MFLFYVLSFFKKGDTIHSFCIIQGGHYLGKYGIYQGVFRPHMRKTNQGCSAWQFVYNSSYLKDPAGNSGVLFKIEESKINRHIDL